MKRRCKKIYVLFLLLSISFCGIAQVTATDGGRIEAGRDVIGTIINHFHNHDYTAAFETLTAHIDNLHREEIRMIEDAFAAHIAHLDNARREDREMFVRELHRANQHAIQTNQATLTTMLAPILRKMEELLEVERIRQSNARGLYSEYSNQFFLTLGNGITYGNVVGMSVAGRHGSSMGFGWQGSFGLGNNFLYPNFHWSMGAKVYPFRWFFVSANYGTLDIPRTVVQNNTDTGHFFYRETTRPRLGLSYLAGFNFLSGNRDTDSVRWTINVAGGAFRNNDNKWAPAWNIGIGIGDVRF